MGLHFFSWIIEKNILTSPIKAGNRASNSWGVVLHLPQSLISSSGGTTPFGPIGPSAVGTWCFTSRKALFLRPEAPRHSGRMGLQRLGRGASPPAKPCSFVRRHHATRAEWTFGGWDVVLHLPQSLVPSSGSTTPLGPNRSSAIGTWCLTSRKALFLRPEAPRHSERIRAVPGSVNSPESVNKTPTSKRMFEGRCFCFLFGFCDFTRIFSFRHVVKIRVPLHSPRSRGGTPVPLFPLQNYLRSCGAR